jgi:predicted RNA binding protein YcfA (HicA-like mRNA interferase family)
LAGKFLQALLAIEFLTFTLRGSHEEVRLAAARATTLAGHSDIAA